MTMNLRLPSVLFLLLVGGCDNVGRIWDRDVDPPGSPTTPVVSTIQIVPVGGDVRTGRPKVRAAYPKDGGWPTAVPVVVEFSESVNEATILPSTNNGTDGRIVLRARGTTNVIPCQYSFLAQGRLLVMRPITELPNQGTPTYEVVLRGDARDCDGLRFEVGDGGEILTSFQVNQATSFVDGRILALFPRDNSKELAREGELVVVFDRPANVSTLVAANLQFRREGGAPLAGTLSTPLATVGVADGRVVTFRPSSLLAAQERHELVVTADIKFGPDGKLDFRGRTPFARFTTVAPAPPQKVELANPATGFDGKINRGNAEVVRLRVTTPADTQVGDVVRARIYGGDAKTTSLGDLAFVERTGSATLAGANGIEIDFTGALGTLARPAFDDGSVTFVAQMQRGNATSGFVHHDTGDEPRFDITPPTIVRIGPPGPGSGTDFWTDLEFPALFGTASERLAQATLADGVNPPKALFASDDSGRFLMEPLPLGRLTAPRSYSLELVDRAGNLAVAPVTGTIRQRGVITGALVGTLVVEAYDDATLQPIAGAVVVVDPGAPPVPAAGQRQGTTDASGRVVFNGISAPSHTVTVLSAGHDLATIYDTAAALVSVPLRPRADAAATLRGTAAFPPSPGATAVIGSTAFDSRLTIGVRTTNTAPNAIPSTAVVPNRPQLVTGFAGVLEPVGAPFFASHGCQVLGAALTTPTPPPAPAAGGAETNLTLPLVPSTNQLSAPQAYTEDFALATGLDTGNLVGLPRVRMTASLQGFMGQALVGLGIATPSAGVFAVQASYSLPIVAGLAAFEPNLWSVVEAQDTAGRVSRRKLLILPGSPFTFPGQVAAIPTIAAPSGPATAAPAVSFDDVFDGTITGSFANIDLTATDGAGRRWVVYASDRDTAGGTDTVQFPDLSGVSAAGLEAGTWTLVAEARVWFTLSGATADDWLLTERVRRESAYARSAPVVFAVP